jgi:hypothetical protein
MIESGFGFDPSKGDLPRIARFSPAGLDGQLEMAVTRAGVPVCTQGMAQLNLPTVGTV